MALKNISVPLYNSSGESKSDKLTVNEFAGRLVLKINRDTEKEIIIECYMDDLMSAWKAVNRF